MRIIGGKMKGKKLVSPDTDATRPTSDRARESLFNLLDNYLRRIEKPWAEVIFADVFAGTGAVGTEALSKGADKCYFFEINKVALKALYQNIKGLENQSIVLSDALNPPNVCQKINNAFNNLKKTHLNSNTSDTFTLKDYLPDIIFMDAPYHHGLWEKALVMFNNQGWINMNTYIVIEIDKTENDDLPAGFNLIDKRSYGRNTFLFVKKN